MYRFSLKDQCAFFERLSILLQSGIELRSALVILESQVESKKKKEAFSYIIKNISSGKHLSKTLRFFKKSFSPITCSVIQIAEETGNLTTNLQFLSNELQKELALKNKIISVLTYPLFIAGATLVLCMFLIGYMFPKITPIFTSMHVPLPWTTRLLMGISYIIIHYGISLIVLLILVVVGFTFLIQKKPEFKEKIQKILFRIPIIHTLIILHQLISLTRTIYMLIHSGTSIDKALLETSKTTTFIPYTNALSTISVRVHAGEKLSQSILEFSHLFPQDMYHLILLAEISGTLISSLDFISKNYEREFENFTKKISSLLEPILMLSMGGIVGFVALSIITPLYAITQNIK